MYDTTDKHDEIRQKIVEYLRDNREALEPFVPFNTGEDLVRSQPSTRSSRSRRVSHGEDRYEVYLENMAKPTTWGGELEIRAFAEAFDRDVLIHRPTNAGQPFDQMVNNKRATGQPRQFVHVAFGVGGLRDDLQPMNTKFSQGEETHPHYESVRRLPAVESAAPPAPNPSSATSSLCGPADSTLQLAEYSTEPLNQFQQARPTLSSQEIHAFLEQSRKQLDTTFAQIINTDRERSSSASSASRRSSSSKRSREDDDEDSDRASKRALRRISLRNKTRAFVTYTTPASFSNGTEISFTVRVDTPPSTPTTSQGKESTEDTAVEEKKGQEGKEPHAEGKNLAEEEKKEHPPARGRSPKADVEDSNSVLVKAQGGWGRGRTKSRSKNA